MPDAFPPNSQLAWKCFSLPGAGANRAGVMKQRCRQTKLSVCPPARADVLSFSARRTSEPEQKKPRSANVEPGGGVQSSLSFGIGLLWKLPVCVPNAF